jgi:CheY-like chemotaxis protein
MSATPVVYFIDDSATMREVIKIAFRRENINVVACHDADSAVQQMEETPPDVVITDVIMPDKDGYDVCRYIKQHPRLGRTPVVLMSGVVNRAVAEKAFSVKADELIRKPFQPQDLITRVRHLLQPRTAAAPAEANAAQASASAAALSSIFSGAVPAPRPEASAPVAQAAPGMAQPVPVPALAAPQELPHPAVPAQSPRPPMPQRPSPVPAASGGMDLAKLRVEVLRLQSQIKKLESELQAEREYSRALEEHIKTLQEAE